MTEFGWTETWPGWANHWIGRTIRVLVGLIGTVSGLVMIWYARGMAGFLRSQPDWDGETITVAVLGAALALAALSLSIRPSRLTVSLAALVAIAIPFVGAAI